MFLFLFFFFFSSRRRHTRSTRDWSSDVCSSDLRKCGLGVGERGGGGREARGAGGAAPGHMNGRAHEREGARRAETAKSRTFEQLVYLHDEFLQKRSEERRVGKGCRVRAQGRT